MSRYLQLYSTTGTAKFTTLATGAISTSTGPIAGRRITLMTGAVPHHIAFGTSTVTATTSSCVAPANSMMDFHFESGQYVAVVAASGSSVITVLDSD